LIRIAYVEDAQTSRMRIVIADTLGREHAVVPLDPVKPPPASPP